MRFIVNDFTNFMSLKKKHSLSGIDIFYLISSAEYFIKFKRHQSLITWIKFI